MRRGVFTVLMAAGAAVMVARLSGQVAFFSTFKSIDAGSVNFAGKKMAALVISNDDSLRVAGEESLVRELSERGIQAVATYRIAPKEELQRAETARPWFERAKVDGIVMVRPVSSETRPAYTSETWVGPSYSSLWSYYGYGWGTVYVFGGARQETTVIVETTVYSVPRDQLIWAAVSETRNARDLRGFVDELVKESVAEMQKQGLARRQPR